VIKLNKKSVKKLKTDADFQEWLTRLTDVDWRLDG